MQYDAVIVGVLGMAVTVPVLLPHVELDIAPHQTLAFDLQDGVAEIGTRRFAFPSRVDDPDPAARGGTKPFLLGSPLFLQTGQELFRYGVHIFRAIPRRSFRNNR